MCVVVAAIYMLTSHEASLAKRAGRAEYCICELLRRVDVFFAFFTLVGDTINQERESVAGAFESEFMHVQFAIFSAVPPVVPL